MACTNYLHHPVSHNHIHTNKHNTSCNSHVTTICMTWYLIMFFKHTSDGISTRARSCWSGIVESYFCWKSGPWPTIDINPCDKSLYIFLVCIVYTKIVISKATAASLQPVPIPGISSTTSTRGYNIISSFGASTWPNLFESLGSVKFRCCMTTNGRQHHHLTKLSIICIAWGSRDCCHTHRTTSACKFRRGRWGCVWCSGLAPRVRWRWGCVWCGGFAPRVRSPGLWRRGFVAGQRGGWFCSRRFRKRHRAAGRDWWHWGKLHWPLSLCRSWRILRHR